MAKEISWKFARLNTFNCGFLMLESGKPNLARFCRGGKEEEISGFEFKLDLRLESYGHLSLTFFMPW